MNRIQLLPLGNVPASLLNDLCDGLSRRFPGRCEILNPEPDPLYALNINRQQYSSTEILARMATCPAPDAWKLLGVTAVDLYIPILTFVFGEAQLDGACALVSTHRLGQEVYGLPPDPERLRQRLLKEAVHELGHTLALKHCADYRCVMAPSHSVEWIDLKTADFCAHCRARVTATIPSLEDT